MINYILITIISLSIGFLLGQLISYKVYFKKGFKFGLHNAYETMIDKDFGPLAMKIINKSIEAQNIQKEFDAVLEKTKRMDH